MLESLDLHYTVAGLIVGGLVGMTGVGGGSLMTPILVVLFGIAPATAVGTDLLFAAATKTVGSVVHGVHRTIQWRVVGRLAAGSMPASMLTLVVLSLLHMSTGGARYLITAVLSAALLLTALVLIGRNKIAVLYAHRLASLDDPGTAKLTVLVGAVLGILVTLSSIGAGAIGVTVLVLLYPQTPSARIVGSDIAHAVPLTLVAGLGHGAMGSLDTHILLSLLLGSLPGVVIGSSISARVSDTALRYVLATILVIVGTKLALDLPFRPALIRSDKPVETSSECARDRSADDEHLMGCRARFSQP
jgi:uncharacterized protein